MFIEVTYNDKKQMVNLDHVREITMDSCFFNKAIIILVSGTSFTIEESYDSIRKEIDPIICRRL